MNGEMSTVPEKKGLTDPVLAYYENQAHRMVHLMPWVTPAHYTVLIHDAQLHQHSGSLPISAGMLQETIFATGSIIFRINKRIRQYSFVCGQRSIRPIAASPHKRVEWPAL